MVTLSVSDALKLVRKNMDELDPNGSIMYQDENGSTSDYGDNRSLDDIIARMLPEAINTVHETAHVWLLEGETLAQSDIAVEADTPVISLENDGVLSFTLKDTTNYLRLVAFRAADSSIGVTDVIPEASPEGRKQLNQYIRGRKDRPRLVQLQGRHTGPSFRYYTIGTPETYQSAPFTAIAEMIYVKEQFFPGTATTNDHTYDISRRLRQNIIDLTTARVMETFGDQRAQAYYQKANTFPTL